MASLTAVETLAPGVELRFPRLEQLDVAYDKVRDILYLSVQPPRAAISVDLDSEAWIRVVRETGEVVGFEIEDFQQAFLRNHPDLAREWHAARRNRRTGLTARQREVGFLGQLLKLLREHSAACIEHHSSRA